MMAKIICKLFDHKFITTIVRSGVHNAEVKICSRCDHKVINHPVWR